MEWFTDIQEEINKEAKEIQDNDTTIPWRMITKFFPKFIMTPKKIMQKVCKRSRLYSKKPHIVRDELNKVFEKFILLIKSKGIIKEDKLESIIINFKEEAFEKFCATFAVDSMLFKVFKDSKPKYTKDYFESRRRFGVSQYQEYCKENVWLVVLVELYIIINQEILNDMSRKLLKDNLRLIYQVLGPKFQPTNSFNGSLIEVYKEYFA